MGRTRSAKVENRNVKFQANIWKYHRFNGLAKKWCCYSSEESRSMRLVLVILGDRYNRISYDFSLNALSK